VTAVELQGRSLTPAEEAAIVEWALCQQLEEDNGIDPDEWLEEQYRAAERRQARAA
jgi:hypothetical protein